ncbi:PDZ domain-containing protein, partial [Candidatus Peregrinibacteria bacterium]|nr:PDZ domain-containing protein [Candidatus Peregrinibacteria bacterium]
EHDEDEGGNYSGALQQRINRFLESLEEKPKEKVEVKNVTPKPYLGIQVQQLKDGLSVIKVVENSPAHKAGLAIGDTIKAINGVTLDSEKALHNFMGSSSPDSKVTVTVLREGKEFAVEATLGVRQ